MCGGIFNYIRGMVGLVGPGNWSNGSSVVIVETIFLSHILVVRSILHILGWA